MKKLVLCLPLIPLALFLMSARGGACFSIRNVSCCQIGEGFIPGAKTNCEGDMGNWQCLLANVAFLDDSFIRHSGCEGGEADCRKSWRAISPQPDPPPKCMGTEYECGPMFGQCTPHNRNSSCQVEEIYGDDCDILPPVE